jgi:predicted DNA-binding transcriptional regulator YafY
LEPLMDAWEVASGSELFPAVKQSQLRKIASSDLHHPRQVESWKTEFRCEKNFSAIKVAIREQQIDFKYYSANESKKRIPSPWIPTEACWA